MKGIVLAKRLQKEPLPTYARQLLGETHSTGGFKDFLFAWVLELKTPEWANLEGPLDNFAGMMERNYDVRQLDVWMPVVKKVLRDLGRYDWDDDTYPWCAEKGRCPASCLPYQMAHSTGPSATWACPACGRRWWFVGGSWQNVADPEEFDLIRMGIIRDKARLAAPHLDEVHDPPVPESPHRVLWPTGSANLNALMRGEEITEKVSVSWGLKAGQVIRWEMAQYEGKVNVVRCGEPVGNQVTCVFVEVPDEDGSDAA